MSCFPGMQKGNLDSVKSDAHGRIKKETVALQGVSVTRVTCSKGAHTMKTETFEGATLEEAEKRKARWLSAHNGVTVRATRTNYAAEGPDQRYAKIMFLPSIEVDYDDPN